MKIDKFLLTAVITVMAATAALGNEDGERSNIRVEIDPETGVPVIHEFRREARPTVMQDPEVEPAFAPPAPPPAQEAEPEPQREFVPINEITIIEKPAEPAAAAAKSAPKEKTKHSIGTRVGFGNPALNMGGVIKIGVTPNERIDAGVNLGLFGNGTKDGYKTAAYEALGFYEWTFGISDDNVLGWYAGPGVAAGWYTAKKKDVPYKDNEGNEGKRDVNNGKFNVGVGGQFGLEVDLGFIDPEHSLYTTFKDAAISFDTRLMFYVPGIVKKFRPFSFSVGMSYRYKF